MISTFDLTLALFSKLYNRCITLQLQILAWLKFIIVFDVLTCFPVISVMMSCRFNTELFSSTLAQESVLVIVLLLPLFGINEENNNFTC